MKFATRRVVDHVPGMKHSIERTLREWTCSNCDYYEEAEEGESGSSG
ncbi:MAG: hypothetical protein HYZ58_12830 [Acidobacteria bacterium]|nr:hypothetical protein [Acidobacteriota bacterium]MBI3264017.1 hypothetical protein [Acidobacteriota bacterium]